jgi:DNA (cytosine-5)-methyltransferase 1
MKILNLYAGIGGNRRLWGDEHEITSVEWDSEIANVYAYLYPEDKLIIGDAHKYLLDHYKEYDFIWTSPPCQSHSSLRFNIQVKYRGTEPKYPDMSLYQEIILLSTHFEGKYVVENVKPYYEPLIKPTTTLHRHLFWTNFDIPDTQFETSKLRTAQIPDLQEINKVDLSMFKLSNKRQVLRNCVLPELGLHVLQHAQDPVQN